MNLGGTIVVVGGNGGGNCCGIVCGGNCGCLGGGLGGGRGGSRMATVLHAKCALCAAMHFEFSIHVQ